MYCTCRCRESRQSAKLLLIELLPPYLDLVKEEFGAFDPYKLDRIWAIMYDNLRSILKNRGGNDYKPEHTGKRKRQPEKRIDCAHGRLLRVCETS